MDIAFLVCLIVFTLALDALALQRFFAMPWARAAGVSALMNVVSFIVAVVVMGMLAQRYESILSNIYYLRTYVAVILAVHTAITLALRTTVEVLVARHWLRDAALARLVLVLVAVNVVTALPGVITQARAARSPMPPDYTFVPAAQGFAAGDGVVVYASLEQQCLVALDLARGMYAPLNPALPYLGYRVDAATTNALVLGITNTLTIAQCGTATNGMATAVTLPCTVSNPACVALAPDGRRVAWLDGGSVAVRDAKTGAVLQQIVTPAGTPASFLGWTEGSAALVCGGDATEWQYQLDAPSSTWVTAVAAAAPTWAWTPEYYRALTNTFVMGATTVTVYATRGLEVSADGTTALLALLPQATYFGIGFAPQSGIFLAQCNREIIAVNLQQKTIAHVTRGLCALLTSDAYRLPVH
jgi:hypothetical protein